MTTLSLAFIKQIRLPRIRIAVQPAHHDQQTDTEARCWNCGAYTDRYGEQCSHCGHAPNPFLADFNRGNPFSSRESF